MSDLRAALETALSGMSPALATAWQNVPFTPAVGSPYQRVSLLPGTPANEEFGGNFADRGFLQVTLHYPPGQGAKAAEDRALAIRSTFRRGASFTSGGLTVIIMKTPAILPAMTDDDGRYVVPVSIEYRTSNQT